MAEKATSLSLPLCAGSRLSLFFSLLMVLARGRPVEGTVTCALCGNNGDDFVIPFDRVVNTLGEGEVSCMVLSVTPAASENECRDRITKKKSQCCDEDYAGEDTYTLSDTTSGANGMPPSLEISHYLGANYQTDGYEKHAVGNCYICGNKPDHSPTSTGNYFINIMYINEGKSCEFYYWQGRLGLFPKYLCAPHTDNFMKACQCEKDDSYDPNRHFNVDYDTGKITEATSKSDNVDSETGKITVATSKSDNAISKSDDATSESNDNTFKSDDATSEPNDNTLKPPVCITPECTGGVSTTVASHFVTLGSVLSTMVIRA